MQKLLKNKYLFCFLNIAIFTFLFLFLFVRLRFATIWNDDIMNLIAYERYSHGRLITGFLSFIFVKNIPDLLNIQYNDFAVISQSFLKTFLYMILVFQCSHLVYKFSPKGTGKRELGLWALFTYFILFAIMFLRNFVWNFDTLSWNTGYVPSNIFFILLWLKIFDIYISDKNISQKDIFIICLLVFGNVCANEMLNTAFIVLMTILLLKNLFKHFIKKQKSNFKYIVISLISTAVFSIFISLLSKVHVSENLWETFNVNLGSVIEINTVKNFIILFVKYNIISNIYLWLGYIVCIISVYKYGIDKTKNIKIIEYIVYSTVGFLAFSVGTIFMTPNCYCSNLPEYNFWFLHPGLLFTFDISLFISILFMLGYLKYNSNNKKAYIITASLILYGGILFIFSHFGNLNENLANSYREAKLRFYQNDKMSIFYLKQGKTIVLPKEQYIFLIPYINPDTMSQDPELYTKIYNNEESTYLVYLEKSYNLDTTPGLTFKPEEEAMKEYFDNGGTFTVKEIDKMKFADLRDNN